MFNPKVKDFLEEKPNLTVIGLYWAGLWRLYAIFFAAAVALAVLGKIME